jgi:hypothetical protein
MKLLSFSFLFGKSVLATVALGLFLAAGAPAAKANGWDDCNRRVSYSDLRYHQAVERFGPYSRDARYWAHERHVAYERCERYRHDYRPY